MATPIQPALAQSYSPFAKFLEEAPDGVREACALRKYRVCFEYGMRIVRVFNWESDELLNLEVVRRMGGSCPVFGKAQEWTEADCSPLLLPCPGNYEIRMPDDSLLPDDLVLEDKDITADVAKCIEHRQVYV